MTLIDNSHQSIDVAMYDFTAHALEQALDRAASRGVQIRLIVDAEIWRTHRRGHWKRNPSILFRTLQGRGPQHKGLMHNKFAIVDHAQVETGSYNWTQSAEHANYENLLIEDDPAIVQAYSQEFETLWSQAASVAPFSSYSPIRGPRIHHLSH